MDEDGCAGGGRLQLVSGKFITCCSNLTCERTPILQEHVREETFDEAAKQEADFFGYIATAYKHYLHGDDEECARVDAQQRQSFADKAEAAQGQVAELEEVRADGPAESLALI